MLIFAKCLYFPKTATENPFLGQFWSAMFLCGIRANIKITVDATVYENQLLLIVYSNRELSLNSRLRAIYFNDAAQAKSLYISPL